MKVLYAIQSTGNGHIGRALEILPILKKYADVDILISGPEFKIDFPYYINYRLKGFGFTFGKNGGIDFLDTFLKSNSLNLLRDIKHLPVERYDLVISDFEPVSAWACSMKKIQCIGLSNQYALLNPNVPRSKKIDLTGRLILQHYAPVTIPFGFHYKSFDKNIFTPVIRKEIRNSEPKEKKHYTVYLPAYDEEKVITHLKKFNDVEWELFSKSARNKDVVKNITIFPVETKAFSKSILHCKGVITAAGFGTTTEAMYLKKKLLVIPQKSQFEQQYNGDVLKSMGVTVIKKLKKKHHSKIETWLNEKEIVKVNYPDNAELIVKTILNVQPQKVIQPMVSVQLPAISHTH